MEDKSLHTTEKLVEIDYTNWEGIRRVRVIKPKYVYYGVTKFHTDPQWLLKAYDVEKEDWRRFTMKDIHSWKPLEDEQEEI